MINGSLEFLAGISPHYHLENGLMKISSRASSNGLINRSLINGKFYNQNLEDMANDTLYNYDDEAPYVCSDGIIGGLSVCMNNMQQSILNKGYDYHDHDEYDDIGILTISIFKSLDEMAKHRMIYDNTDYILARKAYRNIIKYKLHKDDF